MNWEYDNISQWTILSDILGYKGNISVLRVLVLAQHEVSHSELSERTGLSLPGVHKAIPRLIETGIIEYVGSGRQQQVIFRNSHPLSDSISNLFRSEREYYESLVQTLKNEVKELDKKPDSMWIFGEAARGKYEYGDPIQLALLSNVKLIDEITESFRSQLYESNVEKEFDITIEVLGVTLADIESRSDLFKEPIILLWGPAPQSYISKLEGEPHKERMHKDLDNRSRFEAQAWIKLLHKYPEIIQRTINKLDEKTTHFDSGEKQELEEWKHMLESMSFQRLKKFLKSKSERSTRLRQSLPFWEILNSKERNEFNKLKDEL